jgi:hypothetical protein
MISILWRERLTYLAMSLFVAWHTLAMVIAPAPESHATDSLHAILRPYLTLLRIDNPWDFFAPTVGEGSRLSYVIEDDKGATHSFMPAEQLSWFHPSYFWLRSRYYAIMDEPELHADAAAKLFCRTHAALNPVAITFYEMQEEKFTREDYLSGKRRIDAEFFTVKPIQRVACPRE